MQPSPAPEEAIRQLLNEQVAAWNAGDAKAWCKDFTSDAGFVNILGMHFQGRDANERRHAELFTGIFKGSHLEVHESKVHVLGDAAAIADVVLDLTRFRGLPPGIRPTLGNALLRTRMHYALIREAGRWCVVFSQNTAVIPMPPLT